MKDILISLLPFSQGDTRVILVYAKDICGILVFAPDRHTEYATNICGIHEYSTNICGKHKFATNICGKHKYDLCISLREWEE